MRKLKYLIVMPRIATAPGAGYSFPLGIAYISSSMKKAGFTVFTLNLNHYAGSLREVLAEKINKNDIDVVMTGGLSAQFNTIKPILETAKNLKPSIMTVVGGGIVTAEPEIAMSALEFADFGVIGEGELTVVELCHVLEGGQDFSAIDGLIFRKNRSYGSLGEADNGVGLYIITKRREEIANLDLVPWPDYEGFDLGRHLSTSFSGNVTVGKNVLSMIASRSCPYSCTFCFHTVGKKYRQRSLDEIFRELDWLLSKYSIETLSMNDELFARDVPRLKEFCTRIKERNLKWFSSFRVDDMTAEVVDLIKNSNCTIAGFGLESADDRILKSMRKGITLEQIENALALAKRASMPTNGSFIFGDLEETFESANKTLDWWDSHREYNINLLPVSAYPGTFIYKYACSNGIIKDKIQFLKDSCPPVNVSKMSDGEFATVMKRAMDLSIDSTKKLSSFSYANVNGKESVIDIAGVCTACGEMNLWEKVRPFNALCSMECSTCKQRYRPSFTADSLVNLDKNIKFLLQRHEKIAVWGMVYHAVDIFCNSLVMNQSQVYAVDIASSKIGMDLNGKKVCHPDVIKTENIDLVVISALNHFPIIENQIRNNYPNVKTIFSVISLLEDDSDFKRLFESSSTGGFS